LDRDLQTLDEDLRKRQQSLDERTKKWRATKCMYVDWIE
jgi:hypothetical protein